MTKAHSSHPQIISAYPSCEHCVTWSEAGIAIAGGENVYFASDRDAQSQHDSENGRIQVLRVDQFDQDEWPDAPMATIADLSFGEEQSESIVTALAWSPPGLGIHRRCVLAVLTSNLVLSLWETDGSRNSWRRTCVINNHVPKQSHNGSDKLAANSRKASRVRAFVWLPPLKYPDDDRWGIQFLLTADDEKGITLWRISKEERQQYGSWLVEPIAEERLPNSSFREAASMSALQLSLLKAQRVERFLFDTWYSREDDKKHCSVLQIAALFNNSPDFNPIVSIEVQTAMSADGLSAALSLGYKNELQQGFDVTALNGSNLFSRWGKELEGACADYRRKFQLRRVRARFWGFAQSPNRQYMAAVVTFHPQDSYEYTTANTEKSWLVIKHFEGPAVSVEEKTRSLQDVRKATLAYILHALRDETYDKHKFDDELLKIWTAWTELQEEFSDEHKTLRSNLNTRVPESDGSEVQASDTQTSIKPSSYPTTAEICSICNSTLLMDTDAQYTICESGHPFPRCTLSLLAIQQPRISKYCSRCERQYLDLVKLGPIPHRTLIAELFDKFDVCSVCEGKFRS